MFLVTQTFVTGNLKGITIDQKTCVAFEVGEEYGAPNCRYRIEASREIYDAHVTTRYHAATGHW